MRTRLGLIVIILLCLTGCVVPGRPADSASTPGATQGSDNGSDQAGGGGGDSGGNDSGGNGGNSDTGGAGPAQPDPNAPDFVLFSLPECSVVPNGGLSGADGLTLFVAVRNAGPGSWGGAVPWKLGSDSGLQSSGNTGISTGSATTPMQVDLRATDFNRTHTFTIVADPANTIPERDEGNNALTIVLDLPGRPGAATDVPCHT